MPKNNSRKFKTDGSTCVFCRTNHNDELTLGKIIKKNNVTVHYFCMLLSSGLSQNGRTDNEGILGFLLKDIQAEVRRGIRLKCHYCKLPGATIGCTVNHCKHTFHLPCGIKNDSLHQFFDTYCSFCCDHRPRQNISYSDRLSFHGTANSTCPICLLSIEARTSNHTLRAPCCKNSWFHRSCLQRQALNSGYFFKCPLCNNKEVFQSEMLTYGIYIPEQDASWELEENAFQELLYRHNKCDAPVCKCPKGRDFKAESGSWEIVLCDTCGSQGTHNECSNLKWFNSEWECLTCQEMLNANKDMNGQGSPQKAASQCSSKLKKRGSRKRTLKLRRKDAFTRKMEANFPPTNKVKITFSETDEDVDIETLEEMDTSEAKLLNSSFAAENGEDQEIDICDSSDEMDVVICGENPSKLFTNADDVKDSIPNTSSSSLLLNNNIGEVIVLKSSDEDEDEIQCLGILPLSKIRDPSRVIASPLSEESLRTERENETSSASGSGGFSRSSIQADEKVSASVPEPDEKPVEIDLDAPSTDEIKEEINPQKRNLNYVQTTLSPFFRKRTKTEPTECIDLTEGDCSDQISSLPQCPVPTEESNSSQEPLSSKKKVVYQIAKKFRVEFLVDQKRSTTVKVSVNNREVNS